MERRIHAAAAFALAGLSFGGLAKAQPAPPLSDTATAIAEPAAAAGTLNAQMAALRSAPRASVEGAQAPAQAEAPPTVAVAHRVIDAAGAFEGYMRRAAALAPSFADGGSVAKALSTGAGYAPAQLAEGAVAYGALVALQDPGFVEAVRDAARAPAARDALARRLLDQPAAALELPGAEDTARRVSAVLGRSGAALAASGQAVRQASFAIQRQAWSKAPVEHAGERLKAVKSEGLLQSELSAPDTQALMTSLVALRASPAPNGAAARPTAAVARALAVAALAVLGRGGEADAQEVASLLADARGSDCLKMAKLNLYQCLAVAGPHYEDMFCMGQHALADTGQCVVASAGWLGPAQAAPTLTRALAPVAVAPVLQSVSVPVADAAQDGPERAAAFAPPAPPAAAAVLAEAAEPVAPEPAAEPAPAYRLARADIPRFDSTPRYAPSAAREQDDEDDRAPPPRRAWRDARDAADDGEGDPRYDPRGDDPRAYPSEDREERYRPAADRGYGYGYAPPQGYYGRSDYDGR